MEHVEVKQIGGVQYQDTILGVFIYTPHSIYRKCPKCGHQDIVFAKRWGYSDWYEIIG
jgi:hypothetical protein